LVSAESVDVVHDYQTVRAELEKYSEALGKKQEYVFLSKSDSVTPEILAEQLQALKKEGIVAEPVSIIDESEWQPVLRALEAVGRAKKVQE
jgi:GTPase involved in cell partitioning and DNA repair